MFRIESLVAIIRGFVDVGPCVFLSGDEVQNLKDPTQHTEKIALATSSRCPCLDTFAKSLFEWHEAAFFHVLLHGIQPARNEIPCRAQASNSQNDGSSNLAHNLGLHRFGMGPRVEGSTVFQD